MKDLMLDWIEDHKGENNDGTWFVYDESFLEKRGRIFTTEQELEEFLWNYLVENPEVYLPIHDV